MSSEVPGCFGDLNLDQVLKSLSAPKNQYDLTPYFHTVLRDMDSILYRHEVFQDMEGEELAAYINEFAERMGVVRSRLSMVDKLDFNYHRKGWLLEAALSYCDTVERLAGDLGRADLKSRGFLSFRQYVNEYLASEEFQSLRQEAQAVKGRLSNLKYCVNIQDGRFSVRRYCGEDDYSVEVEKVFEKFKQGAGKDYRVNLQKTSGMNHVEAQILDFVARLFPSEFEALDRFCDVHGQFVDESIRVFDREVQFYVAYLEFISDIKHKGLAFCYPELASSPGDLFSEGGFDLALAHNLLCKEKQVVCNDFALRGAERVIVVSGPNQGGKTTFARSIGQMHYLAGLGCPVPGKRARLLLCDQVLTHFEKAESAANLRGKLQDDLVRIHDMLASATPASVLIVNEMFSSTALKDAYFLSREILMRVIGMNLPCVWVSFIDELSTLSENTVSMVGQVDPENPAVRTFKIARMPANGLAYARSIAEKHRLTYELVKERIRP